MLKYTPEEIVVARIKYLSENTWELDNWLSTSDEVINQLAIIKEQIEKESPQIVTSSKYTPKEIEGQILKKKVQWYHQDIIEIEKLCQFLSDNIK